MTQPDPSAHRVDWLRTIAGALAAVASAVLLSTLGAAGTILGAALGSVIVSIVSSLVSQGLARSRQRMTEAQTIAMRRVGVARAEVRRAERRTADPDAVEAHLDHADEALGEARSELDQPPTPPWAQRFRALPWRRIALTAAGFFVAAVLVITVFEMIAQKPVSSFTGGTHGGGTSFSRFDHGSSPSHQGKHKPTPSSTPTSTPTPTVGSSATAGSSPSSGPTPSSAPTPSSEPSPTTVPSAPPGGAPGAGMEDPATE